MPGMNSGLNPADPTVVAAFRSALLHQGLIALVILVALLLIWGTAQAWAPALGRGGAAAGGQAAGDAAGPARGARPGVGAGRSRRGGGCCGSASGCCGSLTGSCRRSRRWPRACPRRSSSPRRASSPAWVQHLVNWGGTSWSYHPIRPPPPRCGSRSGSACGCWSRRGGGGRGWRGWPAWAGAWSCGCSASRSAGSSRPGLTWLFGAPGAVLIYCVAGALIALPGTGLAGAPAGQVAAGAARGVLHRDGGAAGVAGAGLLAGAASHGQPGTLTGHGPAMAQTSAAALPVRAGRRFRRLHRRARVARSTCSR